MGLLGSTRQLSLCAVRGPGPVADLSCGDANPAGFEHTAVVGLLQHEPEWLAAAARCQYDPALLVSSCMGRATTHLCALHPAPHLC